MERIRLPWAPLSRRSRGFRGGAPILAALLFRFEVPAKLGPTSIQGQQISGSSA